MAKDTVVVTQGQPSKMRIQLYDPKTNLLISDRLVEQATEFLHGPKEVHNGPLSLELNLFSQTQVDMAIDYLKKLKGDLPIAKEEKKAKLKTIDKMLSEKEPLLDLVKTVKSKCKTQETLINELRQYNFRFIAADVIQDMIATDPKIGEQIKLRQKDIDKGYQFMVRLMKEAKDPMNDKYDFRLVFGIKIVGEKRDVVHIYLWGDWDEYITIPWETPKKNNFKKVEKVYVFPEFMDLIDRKKWRAEHRKYMAATKNGKEPDQFELSKFYKKFAPYVKGH